jgi:hypothetical protein
VETLTCIDHFDFDDAGFPPAHGVDCVNADRAVIKKPRHDFLSHGNASVQIQRVTTPAGKRLRSKMAKNSLRFSPPRDARSPCG